MTCLQKIFLCSTISFILLIACNDRQDKIGWEPEVVAPLTEFTLDLNNEIDVDNFAKSFFNNVDNQRQNDILYAAIKEGLADSVKKRLSPNLQNDVDAFMHNKNALPATTLLENLYDNLEENGSIAATNSITYYVLTGLPSEQQAQVKNALYRRKISINESISLDMSSLSGKANNLQRLKLLLAINTRLKMNAKMQVYLHDSSGVAFDSLFRVSNGQYEGQMPFANVVGDEYRQRIERNYPTPAEAQQVIGLQTILLVVKSDSLCLDTSLLWVKDFYSRKIHSSVGIMFKVNLDDMIEK